MSTVCRTPRIAGRLLCGLLLSPLWAAGAGISAGFQVAVTVASASQGACVSESQSDQTQSVALVTCVSDNFVSMTSRPGRSFVGAHASAYRFHLVQRPRSAAMVTSSGPSFIHASKPEVTALRVSSSHELLDGQVEILVSF